MNRVDFCQHTSPKLVSKFFCTVCQTFYGETEITVEVLAEALWRTDAIAHPWDEQSEEVREWYRWRIELLLVAAKEVAKEARDG